MRSSVRSSVSFEGMPQGRAGNARHSDQSRYRGILAIIMVVQHKHRNALSAINAVLVISRASAYDGDCAAVVSILDVAEYLPLLMLDAADRTGEFRAQLVGLARQHPGLVLALERFDAP